MNSNTDHIDQNQYQQCSLCYIKINNCISLDCQHVLCHQCFKKELKIKQLSTVKSNHLSKSKPTDEKRIYLKCKVCQNLTVFQDSQQEKPDASKASNNNMMNKVTSQSKVTKGNGLGQNINLQQKSRLIQLQDASQKTIFCITCKNELLSLQQFLSSHHRLHQVQSLQKHFPFIQQCLNSTLKSFVSLQQSLYSCSLRLTTSKKLLNDQYQSNLMKIHLLFQNIRHTLLQKQEQIVKYYQNSMIQNFQAIQNKNLLLHQHLNKCKKYAQWIQANLQHQSILKSKKDILRCSNFYVDNLPTFDHFIDQSCSKVDRLCQQTQITNKKYRFLINNEETKNLINQIKNLNVFNQIIDYNMQADRSIKRSQSQFIQPQSQKVQFDEQYFKNKKKQILQQRDLSIKQNMQSTNPTYFNKSQNQIEIKYMMKKPTQNIAQRIVWQKKQNFIQKKQSQVVNNRQSQFSQCEVNRQNQLRKSTSSVFISSAQQNTIANKISQLRVNLQNDNSRISSTSNLRGWQYN